MGTITGRVPLLKSQKNELLELVQSAGLDPQEFRFLESPSHVQKSVSIERLLHERSGAYFDFDMTAHRTHYSAFSPGKDRFEELQHPGSWELQLEYCRQWLSYLHRELSQPDRWQQLASGSLLEATAGSLGDAPFSPAELPLVLASLDQVRGYLQEELPPDAFVQVNTKLDQLAESARSQGRQTWATFVMGTMVSLVWGGILAPDQARAVLQAIGSAFQRLIGA